MICEQSYKKQILLAEYAIDQIIQDCYGRHLSLAFMEWRIVGQHSFLHSISQSADISMLQQQFGKLTRCLKTQIQYA